MPGQTTPVLSLDLWDTLLRRHCHPDEVKLYTAQRMLLLLGPHLRDKELAPMELLEKRREVEYHIGRQRRKRGGDDEYEIEEVLWECVTRVAAAELDKGARAGIVAELVEGEIRQEMAVSYPDPDLLRLLGTYQYQRLIIISDFYMSGDKVARILAAASLPLGVDGLFLSCDCGLNKRSGRLFRHALSALQVEPGDVLHIGDNHRADVAMATEAGLRALHFTGGREGSRRRERQEHFLERCRSPVTAAETIVRDLARRVRPVGQNSRSARLFCEGIRASVIFTGFSLYIDQICRRVGAERVFFFTREGIFFKRIFDRLQEVNPYDLKPISSRLLAVSRLATFFPSLREITCAELRRMWSQYADQSMRAMLGSLGLDLEEFDEYFSRYNIDADEVIFSPWRDDRVNLLFTDQDFISRLTLHRQERQKQLKHYLQSREFGVDDESVIVDIGWRGTIQDNIAHLLPGTGITGIYLGLQKFFNRQPANTRKYGFLADANRGDNHPVLFHVMPFEMLCYETGGSAVGYRPATDGTVRVIHEPDEEGDRFHTRWISPFQEGVLAGSSRLFQVIGRRGISVREMQQLGQEWAARLLCEPPPGICRAFFCLKQDDTFGRNRVLFPGRSRFRAIDKLLGLVLPEKRRRFLQDLEESGWPQGLLRHRYGGIFYHLGRAKRRLLKNGR